MSEITFMLSDKICQQLTEEAGYRGLELQELIRWILGDWVNENCDLENLDVTKAIPASMQNQMVFMSRLGAAANGSLKCEDCTFHLSVSDVWRGYCPKCKSNVNQALIENE